MANNCEDSSVVKGRMRYIWSTHDEALYDCTDGNYNPRPMLVDCEPKEWVFGVSLFVHDCDHDSCQSGDDGDQNCRVAPRIFVSTQTQANEKRGRTGNHQCRSYPVHRREFMAYLDALGRRLDISIERRSIPIHGRCIGTRTCFSWC
jgi:hypothetical protein